MPKKKGITNLNGKNETDSTLNSLITNINVKSVNIARIIITIIMRELTSQIIEFIPLIIEVLTQ
ncbi:hypothetical protein MTF66_33390 [Pseudoalteromonas sp. 2CM39R]|uniref:hypothetical protein n=1 Tax=Pseudoalteromonas sp. 2CM39R TaxID=2929856 RepID=UPI0020C11521|nr:hypothetical protein [Pseudoalteromonas sp. 2CM39R]MCK8129941.1 hypothetical protein [Pseudoalteromonas sp. 2CM39R]